MDSDATVSAVVGKLGYVRGQPLAWSGRLEQEELKKKTKRLLLAVYGFQSGILP